MKKKYLIRLAIAALIAISLFLIAWDPMKAIYRNKVIEDSLDVIQDKIQQGETDISIAVPDSDILSISGEEDETGSLSDLMDDLSSYSSSHTNLKCLGILTVPDLDIKEPIWDSCSAAALRFGIGRYPLSSELTGSGNISILGHRNRHISTIFYRLQEIVPGTQVQITLVDGSVLRFVVDKTKNVSPEQLDSYLTADAAEERQLTLVTCATELGSGWRFIAICKEERI